MIQSVTQRHCARLVISASQALASSATKATTLSLPQWAAILSQDLSGIQMAITSLRLGAEGGSWLPSTHEMVLPSLEARWLIARNTREGMQVNGYITTRPHLVLTFLEIIITS